MDNLSKPSMKIRRLITGSVALILLTSLPAQGADSIKLYSRPGSKVKIHGTANIIHTQWDVESPTIIGSLEAGPGFPTEPGQAATPGKMDARADVIIMVRTLRSVEPDGKPYSDKMDDIMYDKLRATNTTAKILFHLTELTLKETAKDKDSPYVFEAKGNLAVAGVTNQITMPVNVVPLGDKKLKISGATTVKMTDFKIDPPKVTIIHLIAGDEVKLSFDWMIGPRGGAAAAAAK
jgi:hypothetical protein